MASLANFSYFRNTYRSTVKAKIHLIIIMNWRGIAFLSPFKSYSLSREQYKESIFAAYFCKPWHVFLIDGKTFVVIASIHLIFSVAYHENSNEDRN